MVAKASFSSGASFFTGGSASCVAAGTDGGPLATAAELPAAAGAGAGSCCSATTAAELPAAAGAGAGSCCSGTTAAELPSAAGAGAGSCCSGIWVGFRAGDATGNVPAVTGLLAVD